jgi:PKD repeat protein
MESDLTAVFDSSPSLAGLPGSGATIDRRDWDFGDGTTLMDGSSAEAHTYAGPGAFTVTVTITNSCGETDTATETFTILTVCP